MRDGLRPLATGSSIAILWLIAPMPSLSASGNDAPILRDLSFDELADITVTSVSRVPEPSFSAPAAVTVITSEQLHRSGAVNIAETLRFVPGLDVAQVDSVRWAVSARGFHAITANKMLTLQDGRPLYSSLFGGTAWDTVDPMLEDIDRVEVIRGPGASSWGANAVNGVISIVSKPARDTVGTTAYVGGGNEQLAMIGGRIGAKAGEYSWFRVYAKGRAWDDSVLADGTAGDDSGFNAGTGFRWDLEKQEDHRFTLQGDWLSGRRERKDFLPSFTSPSGIVIDESDNEEETGNLLARWEHDLPDDSQLSFFGWVDHTRRRFPIFETKYRRAGVGFQHDLEIGERNAVSWGADYRFETDSTDSTMWAGLQPESKDLHLFGFFLQDRIELVQERLSLLLGARLEHHTFSGWEPQPTARLAWTPNERNTVWTAASRATRNPARSDTGTFQLANVVPSGITGGLPVGQYVLGNPDVHAEELWAFDLGYRTKFAEEWTFDVVGYLNFYDDLTGLILAAPYDDPSANPPQTVAEMTFGNPLHGESYGTEFGLTWEPDPRARLSLVYTFKRLFLHSNDSGVQLPPFLQNGEGDIPEHSVGLHSSFDLTKSWRLDAGLRYVDDLPAQDIDAYVDLDLRIAWHVRPGIEISVTGRNLLHDQHAEFRNGLQSVPPHEVQRGVYGKVRWEF